LRRAQSAVEYLLILGITIIIVFLVIGYVVRSNHGMTSTAVATFNNSTEAIKQGITNITKKEING